MFKTFYVCVCVCMYTHKEVRPKQKYTHYHHRFMFVVVKYFWETLIRIFCCCCLFIDILSAFVCTYMCTNVHEIRILLPIRVSFERYYT